MNAIINIVNLKHAPLRCFLYDDNEPVPGKHEEDSRKGNQDRNKVKRQAKL